MLMEVITLSESGIDCETNHANKIQNTMRRNRMIEFSCADFAFPILSHEKALTLISLMDFKWVDIGLFQDRSHIMPSDQLDRPEKRGNDLRVRVKNKGLGISDIFFQVSLDCSEFAINHPDPAIRLNQREIFDRAIEYTLAAGCDHFSWLPGVDFGNPDSRAICVDELLWRVERAERNGIIFSVEPHFGSIMSIPEDALEILKEIPGLTIILDHSHFTHQGIDISRVRPLTAYASHIHARGAAIGQMQTSVECNDTDFESAVNHIREVYYSRFICLEYTYVNWENCNRTDNVSETLLLRQKLARLLHIDKKR